MYACHYKLYLCAYIYYMETFSDDVYVVIYVSFAGCIDEWIKCSSYNLLNHYINAKEKHKDIIDIMAHSNV